MDKEKTIRQVEEAVATDCWHMLLAVRTLADQVDATSSVLMIRLLPDQTWAGQFAEAPQTPPEQARQLLVWLHSDGNINDQDSAAAVWSGSFSLTLNRQARLFPDIQLIREYLPYALLAFTAKTLGRAVTVTHFAQTLDGKIATSSGHSRWIGNDENLLHAHRMRALCDGILIGKGTLEADQPALTVRHVAGPNPRRIVRASAPCSFDSLRKGSSEEIWWVGAEDLDEEKHQVKKLTVRTPAGISRCESLLETLFQQGIHSVFIEGGSSTTSEFLYQGLVDIMQLHLAPLVFGSGKTAICLPEIGEVGDAVQFSEHQYIPVGDAVMFVGKPSIVHD